MTALSRSIFVVVEHYRNSDAGNVAGAFLSMADALEFSDEMITKEVKGALREFEITRCAPEPCEVWRRLVNDQGRWSSEWEHIR